MRRLLHPGTITMVAMVTLFGLLILHFLLSKRSYYRHRDSLLPDELSHVGAGETRQSHRLGNDQGVGEGHEEMHTVTAATIGRDQPMLLNEQRLGQTQQSEGLWHDSLKCRDSLCTEYFSVHDWSEFNECFNKSFRRYHRFGTRDKSKEELRASGSCHFMDGTHRGPVALVSFPGSGNTWVRGLLEQATGICTGAMYCDSGLRNGGFNGEGMSSGSVLAVKTHNLSPPSSWGRGKYVQQTYRSHILPTFDSAILIVRNPLDALVAEWTRIVIQEFKGKPERKTMGSSHTGHLGKESFGENKQWNFFVFQKVLAWKYYFNWVTKSSHSHPVLMVKYEEIKAHTTYEISRMLDFLGVPYSRSGLEQRMSEDFSQFHRHHTQDELFVHFTEQQREHVYSIVGRTATLLRETFNSTFGIEDYVL